MANKIVNFKMNEEKIMELKEVATIFNLSITEIILEALNEYIKKLKEDPYYRLCSNIEEASEEESKEILEEIDKLTPEDLEIVEVKHFKAKANEK